MLDSIEYKNLYKLGLSTLVFLILGDFFRRVALFLDSDFNRYTLIFKTLIFLSYIIFIIVHLKAYIRHKITRKLMCLVGVLVLLFGCSNYLLPRLNNNIINISNGEFFIKYMFFPITIITFYVIHDKKELNVKLFKLYEIFFLLNASLIVISFLFDIDVLKSYPNPRRPGYSGLFNRPNQLSYITIVMIAIYYYKASFLKLKYDYYKLIFLIVVALLGGTKRIYFFLIILLIYHVCNNLRTIYRQVLLVFIALLTLTYFLWDKLYLFIENKLELFVQIYNERGFLSALLSYRNDRLSATWNDQILVDWNILNVFVGGCDFTIERPEMDLIDIFFYFGLIGLVVYMLFFKTTLNAIKLKNNYLLFFITLIFFISALTSGFLNSTNIPFVFMIGVFYLNNISQKLV